MRSFWNSPVLLSLGAALFYALATPILRVAGLAGATGFAFCIGYAFPLMVWAATDKMTSSLPTRAMLMTFAAGILLATAFRFSVRAFSLPTGHSSIVSVLTATYPALVVVIGLVFLGEAPKVRPGWLSLGTILVLTGVVIITTLGQKN